MKACIFYTAVFTAAFSLLARELSLEDVSPHFPTKMPVVWQAATNELPISFWIYKRLPQPFTATTISNAIVLAGFQAKGFPKPSTNRLVIWADHNENEPQPPYLLILPDVGQLSFTLGDRRPDLPDQTATNQAAVERAWNFLAQLGMDRSQFLKTNSGANGAYGVFLPRRIDGFEFFDGIQGFQIWAEKQRVLQFALLFAILEREKQSQTATPAQIISCIRAFKTPLLPNGDEPDYFSRIRSLTHATKLTISKITPFYGEGVYGETNTEPTKINMPVAELEAIADLGKSNVTVNLFSPILSSEVNRLLLQK